MGRPSGRLAIVAAVVAGVAVLAVAGRLLPVTPSARPPAAPTPAAAATTLGMLVPRVVGRTLGTATETVHRAALDGGAVELDPQAPGAVVVAQDPPAGFRVPPGSRVSFRTRTDVWPNATPNRLELGAGRTSADYRVVAADPARDRFSLALTLPSSADLRVWLQIGTGRRVLLEHTNELGICRARGGQTRCSLSFSGPLGEEPGIWTVNLAKRSTPAATVRITVTLSQR
jgi:PASTA domain